MQLQEGFEIVLFSVQGKTEPRNTTLQGLNSNSKPTPQEVIKFIPKPVTEDDLEQFFEAERVMKLVLARGDVSSMPVIFSINQFNTNLDIHS